MTSYLAGLDLRIFSTELTRSRLKDFLEHGHEKFVAKLAQMVVIEINGAPVLCSGAATILTKIWQGV